MIYMGLRESFGIFPLILISKSQIMSHTYYTNLCVLGPINDAYEDVAILIITCTI